MMSQNEQKTDIKKSQFVPFGGNQAQFKSKSDIWYSDKAQNPRRISQLRDIWLHLLNQPAQFFNWWLFIFNYLPFHRPAIQGIQHIKPGRQSQHV